MMQRRMLLGLIGAAISLGTLVSTPARADDMQPDAMVLKLTNDVLDAIRADATIRAGDVAKLMVLVDNKIMPNVDAQRMTASAVGPGWRQATPDQRKRLQDEFKTLLVRTYAGALSQVTDMSVSLKPMRGGGDDKEVVVRTEVKGKAQPDPVQLDYRMLKTPGDGLGWKIYNINVLGVWLVETYRTQFSQEVNAHGIDGLIDWLTERNRSAGKKG